MRILTRRLALAAGSLLAGTAIAFAAGSPAQANTTECFDYLTGNGYTLTTARKTACINAAGEEYPKGYDVCVKALYDTGVSRSASQGACYRASH